MSSPSAAPSTLSSTTRILVLASHSDALIKGMCNKGALMEKGRILAIGPVKDILAQYHQHNVEHAAARA